MKFDIDNIRKSMGRKKKTPKKTLEIGSPTDFRHLYHVGVESVPLRPSLSNENKVNDLHRCHSEPKPGSLTLPRNFRQNSCTNALPSPLDFPIPNHDEQTAYDSTRLYNPSTGHKSRPRSRLPSEWGPPSTPSTPRPIHRTSQESFNQSLVMNEIYMHQTSSRGAVTPGSSNYGTMTEFMGTTRSNGSNNKIINSTYVDRRDIERYRDRSVEQNNRSFDEQPRKGILKNARSDSGLNLVEEEYLVPNEILNRTYQQLPYKSPTPFDTNSSLGRRIRSSTNSEQKKNGMNPSPLTRPSQLEIDGVRNEGAISVVPTTPITLSTYFNQQTPLVLCEFTEAKTMSILVRDERPLSVRTIQEVPSSLGSDDSTEDVIIYHL